MCLVLATYQGGYFTPRWFRLFFAVAFNNLLPFCTKATSVIRVFIAVVSSLSQAAISGILLTSSDVVKTVTYPQSSLVELELSGFSRRYLAQFIGFKWDRIDNPCTCIWLLLPGQVTGLYLSNLGIIQCWAASMILQAAPDSPYESGIDIVVDFLWNCIRRLEC